MLRTDIAVRHPPFPEPLASLCFGVSQPLPFTDPDLSASRVLIFCSDRSISANGRMDSISWHLAIYTPGPLNPSLACHRGLQHCDPPFGVPTPLDLTQSSFPVAHRNLSILPYQYYCEIVHPPHGNYSASIHKAETSFRCPV